MTHTCTKHQRIIENIPLTLSYLDRLWFLTLNSVQQWGEDPPGLSQLITPHKVHLGSNKDIQDQALIGLG